MKRFYCVILAMLAVVLYAIVMSGCRAISSNVEVATQPVVETPLAEHIGKVRQGPFVNDAEEFVRNISVLLEEKSPHDYSVRRIEEILLNNGYLEEYFKGNTEPLALYCFEYIINHESLCYVSDNQNVSFSGNDKAIALIAWELMLTYVPYKIGKLQIQGFSEPTTPNKIKQSYHITQKAARSRPRAAFLRGKLGRRQDFSKK